MGKNLIVQARGKGGPRYSSPGFRFAGIAKYPSYTGSSMVEGIIDDIIHCPGHDAPLLEVKMSSGERCLLQAPEGVKVGDKISIGDGAELKFGNVLPLKSIPEGASIYNIERLPGDGGKMVRTSGGCAKLITKFENRIIVTMPSSKRMEFHPECRASIGVIAGGGMTEKPFLKAGRKFYRKRAKNKLYPIVSGLSMNAVDHPLGGRSSHAKGHQATVSRNAPPGRKVGLIAARRTGRKNK